MVLKKILVLLLVFAYPLAVQEECYARKNHSSRSSKKSKGKKRSVKPSAKSTTKESTEDSSNNENSTAQESTSSNTNNSEASSSSTQAANTGTSSEDENEVGSGEAKEVKDMSKDAKWEEFRICMQTSCAGSDEQPNNVECYKSLNFDNAFENCKMLIDENKREDFKNYFTGPFIRAEKKAFCEGEFYNGKFDEISGKCAITVTYTRPKYSGKQFSCGRETRTLTWYIDNKNYVCDASLFGVDNCYQDSAGYSAAKIQKYVGIAKVAIGTASAAFAGYSAATKVVKESKTDKNGNTTMEAVKVTDKKTGEEKDKTAGVGEGLSAGLQAGSGMLSSGASDLASGLILEKEKGDRIFGICNLPNGETIPEGSSKKLTW